MADFRKVLVALAVLVFAVGMANAQQFNCTQTAGAVTPQLASEGLTELVGDIVLDCFGLGTPGLANFTVYSPAPITSRVAASNSGISEALLIVDDAGAPGRAATSVAPDDDTPGCTAEGAVACTYNVFQGIIAVPSATPSVTFLGVPVVPPGTFHRIFRITNIRINANSILPSGVGRAEVIMQLSISPPTSVPLPNANYTVGFVTKSLAFDGLVDEDGDSVDAFTFRQCEGVDGPEPTAYLQFRELFATAFKPRGGTAQTQPGTFYNTESGLEVTGVATGTGARANWGTRLRATFSNIPLGTSVYVACANEEIANNNANISAISGSALLHGGTLTQSFSAADCSGGYARVVAPTATSGTAVWEVHPDLENVPGIDPGMNIPENYDFAIYFVADPDPQTSPATGVTGRVNGNYAPTPTSTSQANLWALAMTGTIPRFIDTGSTYDVISFTICQTNLLFPYVLGGVAGFDTGLAITNTSTDPWGTTPQSGRCTLNFYGDNAPDPFITPVSIGLETGEHAIWASTAMSLASGFNGYIIAQCNFQYAHGFAFVSDIGAHNLAMGYLALILPDVDRIGFRPNNGAASLTSESLNN